MRVKFITTGEGVALTLAATYGKSMKSELEEDFKKTKHTAVRRVGNILIEQVNGTQPVRYRNAASILVDRPTVSLIDTEGSSPQRAARVQARTKAKARPKAFAAKKAVPKKAYSKK